MNGNNFQMIFVRAALGIVSLAAGPMAWAQPWTSVDTNTRYLALGDSLSSGFEAKPVTQGFVYQLYQSGVIDNLNNLLFCTEAVPNSTSADVLQYQVPQVHLFFTDNGISYRKVVTLTVGGNDLLSVLGGADPAVVLATFGNNLFAILNTVVTSFPDAQVYVANNYDPKLPVPGEALLVAALNQVTATVVGFFPISNVVLVDVFSAFQGRSGLLLIERKGAGFNVHPTNAGYQVMTAAFEDAIGRH
jgi:lysophospholipase L1-like esterase